MKLIFLEIHGVLMTPVCENIARLLQKPVVAFKPAVDALNFIAASTGAQVVITSAWRNSGQSVIEQKFKDWGVTAKIKDITPVGEGKANEITRYFIWAPPGVESYVIIDTEYVEDSRWDTLSTHLIRTDPELGLTQEMANRAIEMLNKGEAQNKVDSKLRFME